MPIAFKCPACKERITLSRRYRGKRGKCSRCQQEIVVPGGAEILEDEDSAIERPEAPAPTASAPTPSAPTPSAPTPPATRSASRVPRAKGTTPLQRKLAAVLAGAVGLVLLVIVVVVAIGSGEGGDPKTWSDLRAAVGEARALQAKGADLGAVAALYEKALKPVEGLAAVEETDKALLGAARIEAESAARHAALFAKEDAEGLRAAIKGTSDPGLLASFEASIDASKSAALKSAGLAELVKKDRARALSAIAKAGAAGEPVTTAVAAAALDASDPGVASAGAKLALESRLVPLMTRVLERCPGLVKDVTAVLRDAGDKDAAIPALRILAHNEQANICDPAVRALAEMRAPDAAAEIALGLDAPRELKTLCVSALRALGDRAIPALAKAAASGQLSAATGLGVLGSAAAVSELQVCLGRADWRTRVAILDALTLEGQPPAALVPTAKALLQEACSAPETGTDPSTLEPLIGIARAFGARRAGDDLDATLGLFMAEKRSESIKLPDGFIKAEARSDLGEESRFEVDNDLGLDLVVYAVGPRPFKLAAPKGTRTGTKAPPGRYRLVLAFYRGSPGLLGKVELKAGHASVFSLDLKKSGTKVDGGALAGGGGGGSDRAKKEVARVFRVDQLAEEARTAIPKTAQGSPFGQGGLKIDTEHYTLTSDASRDRATRVGELVEAAFRDYAKFIPPGEDRFLLRFFATKEAFDAWRLKTSLNAYVASRIVQEESLVARARAQALRAKKADAAGSDALAAVAEVLASAAGLDSVSLDNLGPFADALEKLESAVDSRSLERGVAEALRAIEAWTLVRKNERGTILGYHNRLTKELCLFDAQGWDSTLRHEAFHQFLCQRAAKAPSWVHEGLATYFEAPGGRNEDRIVELKTAVAAGELKIEAVDFASLAAKERLGSIDYAVTWSFFYYLAEREPGVLGKVLARAKAGLATPAGVLDAFADHRASEAKWREFVTGLIR